MRRVLILAPSLCLSACATVPHPVAPRLQPVIVPKPASLPAPIVSLDWKDRAFSRGVWSLAADDDGISARFGSSDLQPEFRMSCIAAKGTIRFARAGSIPELMNATMTLASTESARSYPAVNSNAVPATIVSETSANDPQLDSLAFSRGRLLVSIVGTDDLVIPSWPEFARVVEECRSRRIPLPADMPQPAKSDAKIN